MPGPVTLVSRRGEVHVDPIGKMALAGAPMQRGSIFEIFHFRCRCGKVSFVL